MGTDPGTLHQQEKSARMERSIHQRPGRAPASSSMPLLKDAPSNDILPTRSRTIDVVIQQGLMRSVISHLMPRTSPTQQMLSPLKMGTCHRHQQPALLHPQLHQPLQQRQHLYTNSLSSTMALRRKLSQQKNKLQQMKPIELGLPGSEGTEDVM